LSWVLVEKFIEIDYLGFLVVDVRTILYLPLISGFFCDVDEKNGYIVIKYVVKNMMRLSWTGLIWLLMTTRGEFLGAQ
jgi:hypothetical protein